jgi:hypothetical protein
MQIRIKALRAAALLVFLLYPAIVPAACKNVTYFWDQLYKGATWNITGWRVKASHTPGGPYTSPGVIYDNKPYPVFDGFEHWEFSGGHICAENGKITKLYIVVVAYNEGGESTPSNEVEFILDFSAIPAEPPLAPWNLRIVGH